MDDSGHRTPGDTREGPASAAGADTVGDVADRSVDHLVVRVCVAALWSDGSMAAEERNALANLVATVAGDREERDRLRRFALEEVDRHALLQEVAELPPGTRLDLFDRCVALLGSDRRLEAAERRFLGELRRACGVGFWAFQRLRIRLQPVRSLAAVLLVPLLAVVPFGLWRQSVRETVGPAEATSHPELLLPQAPPDLPALSTEDLFQRVRRSVVTIRVMVDGRQTAGGSGAVIGVDRQGVFYVVTNRHVVDTSVDPDARLHYEAEFENGARFDVGLDFVSRRADLALLAVRGMPLWGRPVPMRRRADLRVGEAVYAVGSPLGLRHTFTSGVVSALRAERLQTDATVHSGSSGGPLFDSRGRLCGVVTSAHLAKDFSFALYADTVLEMLAERRDASDTTPAG